MTIQIKTTTTFTEYLLENFKIKLIMYFIISLTHTNKGDKYITLWRPNNAGYCYSKESAGRYETPQKDYHDSETNMPISEEVADELFIYAKYDFNGEKLHLIPNCGAVWNSLGIKMTKHGLQKLPL